MEPSTGEIVPFVGRQRELSQLLQWSSEISRMGIGRFVLITGEAGVGKSRLCAEVQTRADALRWASSRCWAGGDGPPLCPWPELIDGLRLDDQSPAMQVETSVGDRYARFEAIANRARAACADGAVGLVIDDLDGADHEVLLLTRYVARWVRRQPMLLVATWRTAARGAASGRLQSVAREADVLHLAPLGSSDVRALIAAASDAPSAAELDLIVECSGGNPLFVAELLRARSSARDTSLSAVLARRVAELEPTCRRILGAAAVLGSAPTVAETARVAMCEMGDVHRALEAAGRTAALVGSEVRFVHELLRDAFVAALSIPERLRFEDRAYDAVRGSVPAATVRRATHAVRAAPYSIGRTHRAVAACHAAAEALHRGLAFEQSAEWADRGVSLAAESDPATTATLLLTQGRAVAASGRLGDARLIFQRAIGPAEVSGDPRLLAQSALGLGGTWVEEQRDECSRQHMMARCRQALDDLSSDESLLRARLRVRLAAEAAYDGAPIDEVRRAVDAVRASGDDAAFAEALSLLHHSLLLPHLMDERLSVASELIEAASRAPGSIYPLVGLCWRTVDLYQLGRRDAERAFVELRTRASALDSQAIQYIVSVLDVMRALRRGDLERAASLAETARALGDVAGDADALAYYGAHQLALCWIRGRVAEMTETVEAVLQTATLRRRDQIYKALHAYTLVLRGEREAARESLDVLLWEGVDDTPTFSTWSGTIAILVELAAELDDADLALDLARRFRPIAHLPVMPSLAVVCLGPGERVIGKALAVGGRLDAGVDWLRQALVANRRLGNRPFAALTRVDLAAALLRRGGDVDRNEALALIGEAIALGRQLGMTDRVAGWEQLAAELARADRINQQAADVWSGAKPSTLGTLIRLGASWRVCIGDRMADVDHSLGMSYVAELVARPDTDVRASRLAVCGGSSAADEADAEPILDRQSLAAFRRRLDELDRELDMADLTGNADRGRRAGIERDQLLDEMRRSTGLGGRSRRMTGDAERCRMRVSKAIRRAIKRLDRVDPALAAALGSRIRTGHVCRYDSDPLQPIRWTVRRNGHANADE